MLLFYCFGAGRGWRAPFLRSMVAIVGEDADRKTDLQLNYIFSFFLVLFSDVVSRLSHEVWAGAKKREQYKYKAKRVEKL